jgi:hypothetical protein
MILYVNGDSHTAAAEAVNPWAFAEDDPQWFYLGRAPHPENLAISWSKLLSLSLKTSFHCHAESGSSNTRILRVSRDWLSRQPDSSRSQIFMIIQWSTWEREEWEHHDSYYQVNASGVDRVPQELQEKYRQYILGIDWAQRTQQAHQDIYDFHYELTEKGVKHIFFNGNNDFSKIVKQFDWGKNYIGPYDPGSTYNSILRREGFDTVDPESWHFGKDAHSFWHRFMLKYIIENKFI